MKYKSIDANATDDNEVIELAHCGDCGYVGNFGIWRCEKTITNGLQFGQIATKLKDDAMWDIGDNSEFGNNEHVEGIVICPICGSLNFY